LGSHIDSSSYTNGKFVPMYQFEEERYGHRLPMMVWAASQDKPFYIPREF